LRRHDAPARRAVALGLVALLHMAILALLLFGLLLHTIQSPERLLEVSLGGPLGAQIKIPPATPAFIDPDTPQPITTPEDVAIETPNTLGGSPDVTRPAEAIADAHAFPTSGAPDDLHRTAMVKLLLSISENGDVYDAQIVESSGASSLDSLAIAWVKQRWRYRPALRNGMAIAVTTTAIVKFAAGG
jgi:TonB family protein